MLYLTSHNISADAVESSVWSGAAATNGQFEGFLTAATGAFAVNGNTVPTVLMQVVQQ